MQPPQPRSTLFPYTTLFRSPETMARLREYSWAGNVRELENAIRRLVVLTNGEQAIEALVDRRRNGPVEAPRPMRSEEHTSELQSLTNLVCRLLLEKKKNK